MLTIKEDVNILEAKVIPYSNIIPGIILILVSLLLLAFKPLTNENLLIVLLVLLLIGIIEFIITGISGISIMTIDKSLNIIKFKFFHIWGYKFKEVPINQVKLIVLREGNMLGLPVGIPSMRKFNLDFDLENEQKITFSLDTANLSLHNQVIFAWQLPSDMNSVRDNKIEIGKRISDMIGAPLNIDNLKLS